MSENANGSKNDPLRTKYGFWIVFTGIVVVLVVFLASLLKWSSSNDVATSVGSVTSVLGTLIGAFFGIQVGSAGKEKEAADRKEAEDKALHFAAHMSDQGKDALASFASARKRSTTT